MTCRDLVDLTSDYLDGRLSLRGSLAYWSHLAICPPCRIVLRQFEMTRAWLRLLGREPAGDAWRAATSRRAKEWVRPS